MIRRRALPLRCLCPRLRGTIFIVTYGRSGSTLLQAILNTIPGAHIRGENFDTLGGLYEAVTRARRSRETWGQTPRAPDHPWSGADRMDPEALERDLLRAFVAHVLRPPRRARWIGCKEIRFQPYGDDLDGYLDFIRRAFPGAFILFNSRDARTVAASKWWALRPPDEVEAMVAGMDARFAAYHAAHPDRTFHLHHEATVADPASLHPLFAALGEPMDIAAIRRVLSNRLDH